MHDVLTYKKLIVGCSISRQHAVPYFEISWQLICLNLRSFFYGVSCKNSIVDWEFCLPVDHDSYGFPVVAILQQIFPLEALHSWEIATDHIKFEWIYQNGETGFRLLLLMKPRFNLTMQSL
jgi:hypothetical protein